MAPTDSISRSSSMDAREGISRSNSHRRTSKVGAGGASGGRRRGPGAGNELFVCFAPRTSLNLNSKPVLSPTREKVKEHVVTQRRPTGPSKFSKKQCFEGEEPSSPKVTCFGQVRVKHKRRSTGTKEQEHKGAVGSEAEGKLEKNSTSNCGYGRDFSCFGLPCACHGSLAGLRSDKKGRGAVFAKSLVLIQQEAKDFSVVKAQSPFAHTTTSSPIQEARHTVPVEVPHITNAIEPPVRDTLFSTEEEEHLKVHLPIGNALLDAYSEKPAELNSLESAMSEEDAFESEPPPPNALLLMHHKKHSCINFQRSSSAPVQCRLKHDDETDQMNARVMKRQLKEDHKDNKLESGKNIHKLLFKRCKSLSQTLTNHLMEKAREKRTEKQEETYEDKTTVVVVDDNGDRVKLGTMNKVSLDLVPETRLWEACSIVRHPKGEKGNKIGPSLTSVASPGAYTDDGLLEAEVEAANWRCCAAIMSASVPEPLLSSLPQMEKTNTRMGESVANQCMNDAYGPIELAEMEERKLINSFGRSWSVGNCHGAKDNVRYDILLRSFSVGSQGVNRKYSKTTDTSMGKFEVASHVEGNTENLTICIVQGEHVGVAEYICASKESSVEVVSIPSEKDQEPTGQLLQAGADSKVLLVEYNLGTFQASADAALCISAEIVPVNNDKDGDLQQNACTLQGAVSHLHEVGAYAQLLKTFSGKEHVSFPAAVLLLQRCKSEPVKVAPFGFV